jgi:hypothetical protein
MALFGRRDSGKRAVHDSVGKSDASDSLESRRLRSDQCPAKRVQIQQKLLCNSDSWPAIRLAQNSGWENQSKTVGPCREPPSSHHNSDTAIHAAECNEESSTSPYSPDLAPSDFYLFGCIKQVLFECEFTDWDLFLQEIRDILGGIKKATLDSVFCNWMERLHQFSAMGGEYVE